MNFTTKRTIASHDGPFGTWPEKILDAQVSMLTEFIEQAGGEVLFSVVYDASGEADVHMKVAVPTVAGSEE